MLPQDKPPVAPEPEDKFETHQRMMAAWIHYCDETLLKSNRSEPFLTTSGNRIGRRVYFIFDNPGRCAALRMKWLMGDTQGDIKKFLTAVRAIDDIIHADD